MPFAVLQEKPLASEVLLGCWCSTMDLVALTTADGQLCVHRLDWRKVRRALLALASCVC